MKVKELIEDLTKQDPEMEVDVAVYGCGGYEDSYPVEYVEMFNYGDDCKGVRLEISCSCNVHRKFKNCGAV